MKTKANQSAAERNITMVALADIQPSGFNPRKRFDETSLYELAESIKQQGVLQPITVRPVDGTDRYGIVFGERRYRASVIAGRDEIPAIVTELSDEEAEEMAITENLQRKDVTPVEEAAAYQRLIESGRHTVQTLAQLFGKNENYIRTRLKFTALSPKSPPSWMRMKSPSAWRLKSADTGRTFSVRCTRNICRKRERITVGGD